MAGQWASGARTGSEERGAEGLGREVEEGRWRKGR